MVKMDIASHAPAPPAAAHDGPEEALDQLLGQIIRGFFVLTDGQGALSKWSDPAELLFDLPADQALGQPFFGRLVDPATLTPEAEAWHQFLRSGDTPGARGVVTVDAARPGGGTFPMEAVFIPVKLDEGFDFSLFLEDLSFELPLDLMLLRMRQQHPVVIKALRGALADEPQPWEDWRTAGTLVAFRPLVETPWMEDAMRRREEAAAAAEEELQSRIQAYEMPDVQGTDVYDLEDARAVIDRLKWATERIEELEERSRIMEDTAQQVADARLRAEAAERAAQDARAELAGAIAERPVDASEEAERLELLARLERVERAATEARELAVEQRRVAETERSRAAELEGQRAELTARLEQLERRVSEADAADSDDGGRAAAEAAAAEARAARDELAARLEALEQARTAQDAAIRSELAALAARADEASAVRAELEHLRAAATTAERDDLSGLRAELDELRGRLEAAPRPAELAPEDRRRLEQAQREAEEARAGLEAMRAQAEELRGQSAALREEAGHLQARLRELADGDGQARHDVDALRREQEEIRAWLEEARRERDEARQQVREAIRHAEETRIAVEREAREEQQREIAAATESAVSSAVSQVVAGAQIGLEQLRTAAETARLRLDDLDAVTQDAIRRADEARSEATVAREEAAELRDEARDAQRTAREATERIDLVDRGAASVLGEVRAQQATIEELATLARAAQQDASESRAQLGDVAGREQELRAALEALRADVQAVQVDDLRQGLEAVRVELHQRPPAAEVHAEFERLRAAIADVQAVDPVDPGALDALGARLDALEAAGVGVPEGLEARVETLRENVSGALGRLEALAAELNASRTESGVRSAATEQRLADSAADVMAARTEAEQARRGLDGLREELTSLREYAAATRAEAAAAKEAAAAARRTTAADERTIEELRAEVRAALAAMQELSGGVEEARQAAVAARRDADAARVAADRVGQASVATTEKFTEVWQQMVSSASRSAGSGVGLGRPAAPSVAPKKEEPAERLPREGFDDQHAPMALLDLKGKFKELNPAFSKLVGYREHEFAKATWPSALDRAVYKEQLAEFGALVAGDVETVAVQSTYMHGQGLMVLVSGEMRLVRDDDGAPASLLLVADHTGPHGG